MEGIGVGHTAQGKKQLVVFPIIFFLPYTLRLKPYTEFCFCAFF